MKYRPSIRPLPLRVRGFIARSSANVRVFIVALAVAALFTACAHDPVGGVAGDPTCIIVLDAGSSGTRGHIYKMGDINDGVPSIKEVDTVKDEHGQGLSKYFEPKEKIVDSDGAVKSIRTLFEGPQGLLAHLRPACGGVATVEVRGTAGMRELEKSAAREIYDAVEGYLNGIGMRVSFIGTIKGTDEALYLWIAVNQWLGVLKTGKTAGALDLGGASTQIAFEAEGAVDTVKKTCKGYNVRFGKHRKHTFPVYTCSYQGYGQDKAREKIGTKTRACFAVGYNDGTGRYYACRDEAASVLTPKTCEFESCGLSNPDDYQAKEGVFQPELPEDMQFYASSAYLFNASFFNLGDSPSPGDFADAGKPHCATEWTTLKTKNPRVLPEYLNTYCFAAAWIPELLNGYGFSECTNQIKFNSEIPDWTAGAAICSRVNCENGDSG